MVWKGANNQAHAVARPASCCPSATTRTCMLASCSRNGRSAASSFSLTACRCCEAAAVHGSLSTRTDSIGSTQHSHVCLAGGHTSHDARARLAPLPALPDLHTLATSSHITRHSALGSERLHSVSGAGSYLKLWGGGAGMHAAGRQRTCGSVNQGRWTPRSTPRPSGAPFLACSTRVSQLPHRKPSAEISSCVTSSCAYTRPQLDSLQVKVMTTFSGCSSFCGRNHHRTHAGLGFLHLRSCRRGAAGAIKAERMDGMVRTLMALGSAASL